MESLEPPRSYNMYIKIPNKVHRLIETFESVKIKSIV
jgi:hypothetical protein